MKTIRKKKRFVKISMQTVSVGQVIKQIATDDTRLMAVIAEQVEQNSQRAKKRY